MDCQVASTKCCCGRGDAHEVSSAPACKGAPAAATHNLQRQQQYVLAGFGLFLMLPPPPPSSLMMYLCWAPIFSPSAAPQPGPVHSFDKNGCNTVNQSLSSGARGSIGLLSPVASASGGARGRQK